MADQNRDRRAGNHGTLFILSAPSGAGKTTLCRALRRHFPDLQYSISYTTRTPRKGERDGQDYHFISPAKFEAMIDQGQWAEWARVHGNYYGTSAEDITAHLDAGQDVLLDIDVQGAAQILKRYPKAVSIFIMPPSMSVLKARLEERGTDPAADINKRLAAAQNEMAQKDRYHHVVINDQLEQAQAALIAIVQKYRQP